jgi:ATP-binding cassette, subfamily B, bacterial PglK
MRGVGLLLDRGQRIRLALLVFGMLVGAFLEMLGIGAIPAFVALWADNERLLAWLPESAWTDRAMAMDPTRLIAVSAGILGGLFLLKNSYLAVLLYAEGRILRDLSTTLSRRLFRAYLHSPYVFHLQRNSAQIIRNASTEVSETIQLFRTGVRVARETLVLVVVLVLLLLVDPLVSLSVFVVLGAIAGAFYMSVRRSLARRGELVQAHRGRRMQALQQGLGAIKDAKVMGREAYLLRMFDAETHAMEHHDMYQRVVVGLPRLFLELVAVTAVLVVAVVFVLLDRPAETMLPVLALLAVAVVRLVPALNTIASGLSFIRYQWPSLHLIGTELENLEVEYTEAASSDSHSFDVRECISLRDLRYEYPGVREASLDGLSCEISAGHAVAFIGPSGAGKSTLIDIILGLLSPTAGQVSVDGTDIQVSLRAWQRQIGFVPQNIYLLDDTIRRNIAFGLPDDEVDEAAVVRAVRAAKLDGLVASLPEGLNTRVGDRGVRFSGGQRQRIGIARALYHVPRVLIMDEATSALDDETEREVISAIGRLRGEQTVIIIAHRLSTVSGCDRIYMLDRGRIADEGTLADLIERHEHLRLAVQTPCALDLTVGMRGAGKAHG